MLGLWERSGARVPEGLLRRVPLARRAAVLQVLRLLQVPDGRALHGGAGPPLLLHGMQEEDRGLRGVGPGGGRMIFYFSPAQHLLKSWDFIRDRCVNTSRCGEHLKVRPR